jgi:multicomponent Na+:H+ antiporter subunit B
MTSSLVLRTTTRWLAPAMLVCSAWLLLRGHDAPGGGFVGGLVGVAAFLLNAFAEGPAAARARLRLAPQTILAVGLLVAIAAAAVGPLSGRAWMEGLWWEHDVLGVPVVLGTPLMFDTGVYLVVAGSGLAIVLGGMSVEE